MTHEHGSAPLVPGWPEAGRLRSARLRLEPVRARHAEAMVGLLADPELYRVTGDRPPTLEELRARYARWESGQSPDGSEGWLNWVVLLAGSVGEPVVDEPVGWVQATTTVHDGRIRATLAWVVGTGHQGRGYASEAAGAVVGWLRERGTAQVRAEILEGHLASERVAARIGLAVSGEVAEGERVWVLPERSDSAEVHRG
jgi:RimJ/RimL family protein N-acetyltransferase